jgi:hypothetical protein
MVDVIHQYGIVLVVLVVLLTAAACAAHYMLHPGALNVTDSTAYDALLVAETAIDLARLDLKSGQLPDRAKDPLNRLIAAYNLTRDAWLTYRGAVTMNVPPQSYLDQLNKNLSDLAAAIRAFQEAK